MLSEHHIIDQMHPRQDHCVALVSRADLATSPETDGTGTVSLVRRYDVVPSRHFVVMISSKLVNPVMAVRYREQPVRISDLVAVYWDVLVAVRMLPEHVTTSPH